MIFGLLNLEKHALQVTQDREVSTWCLLSPSGDQRFVNSFEYSLGGINCYLSVTTRVFCWKINTETLVSLSGFGLLGLIVECNQCK